MRNLRLREKSPGQADELGPGGLGGPAQLVFPKITPEVVWAIVGDCYYVKTDNKPLL